MRTLIPLFACVTTMPVTLLAQDTARDNTATSHTIEHQERALQSEATGIVINPDRTCADRVVVAEGREGEGQFYRRPAEAGPHPLTYAVDYAIEGCAMVVTTTGQVQQLVDEPEDPQLYPAQ